MLYDVLRRQVPNERFYMSHKVISISQQDDFDQDGNEGNGGVTVESQDGSTVRGGILVCVQWCAPEHIHPAQGKESVAGVGRRSFTV